jgi:hypothetical protein
MEIEAAIAAAAVALVETVLVGVRTSVSLKGFSIWFPISQVKPFVSQSAVYFPMVSVGVPAWEKLRADQRKKAVCELDGDGVYLAWAGAVPTRTLPRNTTGYRREFTITWAKASQSMQQNLRNRSGKKYSTEQYPNFSAIDCFDANF